MSRRRFRHCLAETSPTAVLWSEVGIVVVGDSWRMRWYNYGVPMLGESWNVSARVGADILEHLMPAEVRKEVLID